jgi:glycosyltransferase involved in cell wall biosynthesis
VSGTREGGSAPAANGLRRAMVITTNFPPDASVGTMRTLRLARHLAHDVWEVDVLTQAPERLRPGTVIDPLLLDKVPAAVKVIRAPAWRPFERLTGAVRRVIRPQPQRGNESAAATTAPGSPPAKAVSTPRLIAAAQAIAAIPDREISWLLPAIAAGWRHARRRPPDVIYSSGPPFTAHLAGAVLARILRRPWVADFRDPWARAPWRDGRFAFEKRAWTFLERFVATRADAALFVTETNRQDFAACYGDLVAKRFQVVPNGCDPADFDGLTPQPSSPMTRFVLLHAGSLYGARNPAPLLRALRKAISSGAIHPEQICLRFIGRVGITGLQATVHELGLDQVVEFVSHMPRRAALQQMLDASALLVVQPITKVSVPAKLYEYMAAGRPVLALAAPGGETAEIVTRNGAGIAVHADDEEAIARALVMLVDGRSRPFVRVDRAVYDGAQRAAEMVHILGNFAGRNAGHSHDARHSVTENSASREATRA